MTTTPMPSERFISHEPELDFGFATAQGTRSRQEDAGAICKRRMAIFDGLGGHGGGDKASLAAAQAFANPAWGSLDEALRMANGAVLDVQHRGDAWNRSASSTVVAIEFTKQGGWSSRNGLGKKASERHLTVSWAGDSRVYLLRSTKPPGERLVQLTRDHHNGDGLTACLGQAPIWQTAVVATTPGDLVVLTTDGLHNLVPDLEHELWELYHLQVSELAHTIVARFADKATDNATLLLGRLP